MIKIPSEISGPISFSEYKLKGKPLLLFGDIHNNMKGMCEDCSYLDFSLDTPKIVEKSEDCYTLSSWIQKIVEELEGTDLYLDLFVEDRDFVFQKKSQNINFDGRLSELNIFNHQIHPNLRYHSVDIRGYKQETKSFRIVIGQLEATFRRIEYLFQKYPDITSNQIIDEMSEFLITRDNLFRNYAFLCATSKQYSEDLEDFVSENIEKAEKESFTLFKPLYIKIIQSLVNSKSMSKQYQGNEIHSIGKQLRKILVQEKYKGDIEELIQYMAGFIIDQNLWFLISEQSYDHILNIIEQMKKKVFMGENTTHELKLFTEKCLIYYTIPYLMDLYAIPRILYDHLNSEIKIYSAGLHHINILEDFLEEFYPTLQGRCVFNPYEDSMRCLYTKNRRKGKCFRYFEDPLIVKKFT